ncbi:hypothetical protein HanXRQr2_Chr04g0171771 [Helianthus annuus]|uniref:Uncharacterized protein n=1 Tax=Helianthus annuus TaxID=4232 RepID=A0A251UZH5_HELAN|nr:hypothetical protein HanXRQr2_Chr04g0171771 [Helianthus annuus]KAJ0931730.1 hypothetical protein HanPSC8_Chr04g0165331 [Helianthus annuus]
MTMILYFWSLRTVYRDLTVRITCPDAANSRTEVFGSDFEWRTAFSTSKTHQWMNMHVGTP